MIDPRERFDDPEEVMRIWGDALKSQIWNALPGIVESIATIGTQMTVTVQPTIKGRITGADGSVSHVNMPLLPDVPVVFMGGGGAILTFPINVGDECLCVFSSLCIDAWWQLGGVQKQTDIRSHDLSDAFAIFGPRSQANLIPNLSLTSTQLRTVDGTAYYELIASTRTINIVAPGGINMIGPVNTTGALKNNAIDVGSGHEHMYNPGTGGATETSPPNV
jgi:hypothetical protein